MLKRTFFIIGIFCSLLTSGISANVEVYFSPQGGCETKITELIEQSKESIDVAMYSLNNTLLLKALDDVRAKEKDIKIRILVDRVQAGVNYKMMLILKDKGYDVKIHSKNRIQHNKYAIFDGKKVVTGSYNWTNNAEKYNEENCLILDDDKMVQAYSNHFDTYLWLVNTTEKSDESFTKLRNRVKKTASKNTEKRT